MPNTSREKVDSNEGCFLCYLIFCYTARSQSTVMPNITFEGYKMDPTILHNQNRTLFLQRNILLLITGILLLGNVMLAFATFSRREKTIIVPANLGREVVIEGKDIFDEAYIEEMTLFFSDLLLNLTPQNINYKSSKLLRYVEASAYHKMKEYFVQEGEKYNKYRLSTKFSMNEIKIFGMKVEITGILSSKFGEDSESNQQRTFVIEYDKHRGKLQIVSFQEKGRQ